MLHDVLEIITATGAPGVTTNKLYNVSGNLFWNGTQLDAGGGGGGTRIEDTATDTFVDTEQCHNVLNVDTSQLKVLEEVRAGKSLRVWGAPG